MDRKRQNLIFAGLCIAVMLAYALVIHRPQQKRLDQLRAEIARTSVQATEDAAKAQRIPSMRLEVERLRRQYKDFDRSLPGQQELAGFLREISLAAESQRLQCDQIQPGNPTTGDLYNRLPIVMSFRCTFADLVGFIEELNGMARLTRIENLQISPITEGSETLDVRMQVNIYFTKS